MIATSKHHTLEYAAGLESIILRNEPTFKLELNYVGHARCVVPAVKTPRDRPRPGFVSTALRGSAHEIYKGKGRGRGSFRTSYETVHKNST
jgi:hypothetical protein